MDSLSKAGGCMTLNPSVGCEMWAPKKTPKNRPFADLKFDTQTEGLGKYTWIDVPWKSKTMKLCQQISKGYFHCSHGSADQDTTPRCSIKRLHRHKITFTGSYSSHLTQEFRTTGKARFKGRKVGGWVPRMSGWDVGYVSEWWTDQWVISPIYIYKPFTKHLPTSYCWWFNHRLVNNGIN